MTFRFGDFRLGGTGFREQAKTVRGQQRFGQTQQGGQRRQSPAYDQGRGRQLHSLDLHRMNPRIGTGDHHRFTQERGLALVLLNEIDFDAECDRQDQAREAGTGTEVDLIEQDQRKAAFLREAVMVTGANARVHATKIEQAKLLPAPLVVSRALAPLTTLLRLAKPLLTEDGFCLFPKTRAAEPEITEAERHWSMRIERFPSRTDANGVILRIGDLRPFG